MTRDGKSEAEVRWRIQVGANVWRVEGVMTDRKISRKLKGKVLMSFVMPVYLYRLEMVALIETATEAAFLQEQLGQEDCRSEEGGEQEDG